MCLYLNETIVIPWRGLVGSIKKDFLDTIGVELSDRFYLADYPKMVGLKQEIKLKILMIQFVII